MQIHIFADDTKLFLGFAPGISFSVAGQSTASCLRKAELFMLKVLLKVVSSKNQLLICAEKNTLDLISARFVELEASLNLKAADSNEEKLVQLLSTRVLTLLT